MPNLRLDGYVRVSKVGGRAGESFISPDDQKDRIAAWARSRDVTIAEWHIDLDQTGGKLQRPGLDALMTRVRSGETGGVAVAYVDRLSRADVGDALRLVEEIHEAGGRFAALDLGIDPTTPFGEFGMTVLLALGRMQRRRIADGWNTATERAVSRGVHAKEAFGYRKSAGKGSPLAPDPDEAPVIPVLFARRAAGESWAALARWMDGQVPPRGGGLWTRRAIETVISNRVYLGEARYGQHRNPAAHKALVGVDAWEAAQLARGPRPARGEPALLAGLVRCAGCRHRLQPATVGRGKVKVYRCKRRHQTGECPAPAYVSRVALEEHVERLFVERYSTVGVAGHVASVGLEAAQRAMQDAEAELAAYRDDTRVREVLDALGDGGFAAGLQVRAARVLEARAAFDQARREATGIELGPALDVWPTLTVAERRRVMVEGVDAAFLRRADVSGTVDVAGRVKVFWRGEAPHDLPGPGIRVELRGIDW